MTKQRVAAAALVLCSCMGLDSAHAIVRFSLTDVTYRSDLTNGDFIGVSTWELQGLSESGDVLSLSGGPDRAQYLGEEFADGDGLGIFPTVKGGEGPLFIDMELNGVSINEYYVDGAFDIAQDLLTTTLPRVPINGMPGFYEYQSIEISDEPVEFYVSMAIYDSIDDAPERPKFLIEGNGPGGLLPHPGTGSFVFHTIGPQNNAVGLKNSVYTWAVPEPGSVCIWLGLLVATVFAHRVQLRPLK